MRIGMFSTSLPEPEHKPGGVDVLIERLCNELQARGHDVCMYSFSPAPEGFAAEHVRLKPDRWRRSPLFRMIAAPVIFNRVSTRNQDVLHLHGDDWFLLRRPVPTVRTFYGSARDEARTGTSLKRRVAQALFYRLELLAARLATATYDLIPSLSSPYGALGSLGCGVDVDERVTIERQGPPTILFVGTWRGRKRGQLLAEAFRRDVLPTHPDAELLMVSDEAPDAEGIRWFPRPSDDELRELYRRSWVFCLPSAYEGFGIPYLEAMGAGTPVVATPNPGAEHLLGGGRFGRLVEPVALGATLAELLDDGAQRARLAAAGLARAKDFSWDRIVAAHIAAYEDAIERGASSRAR